MNLILAAIAAVLASLPAPGQGDPQELLILPLPIEPLNVPPAVPRGGKGGTCNDAMGESTIEQSQGDPYPLSQQLRQIEKDLASAEYQAVVAAMIPTDLEAEWQRVATPDNYHAFEKAHGGRDAVARDPELRKAHARRLEIAERFLDVMRAAYTARKRPAPFSDRAALHLVLERGDRKGALRPLPEVPVLPFVPSPEAERQWPAFRGPSGLGVAPDPRIPARWSATENVAWKAALPGRGNSSPVLWGDRLFVTAEAPAAEDAAGKGPDRFLLCYDRRDGRLLWRHAAPRPAELEGLYGKNTFASSTPVTDGERVIVFLGNAGLLSCDVEGKRLWHRDLGTFPTTHGPGATPVLYRDLVILVQDQTKGASLFAAFDKRTGEKRWQRPRKGAMCWSTPALLRVGDRDELVYNGSLEVTSYDPATGETLWTLAGPSKESVPMIATGGGLLFSTSGRSGPTIAIRPGGRGDVTETHLVWRMERGGPHVPSPAWVGGRLFLLGDTGILTCIEAATGNVLYQQRLRGWFSASPIVLADRLLLVNENGLCSVVGTGPAFELLGENDLGETTHATPAVLGGRIYFRTRESLICVGGK